MPPAEEKEKIAEGGDTEEKPKETSKIDVTSAESGKLEGGDGSVPDAATGEVANDPCASPAHDDASGNPASGIVSPTPLSGVSENGPSPSAKKRSAGRQITKDSCEDDDGDEGAAESTPGTFAKADANTLASRRIVKTAFSFSSAPTPGAASTAPSFGGFGAATPFGGLASAAAPSDNPFLLAAKASGGGFGFGSKLASPPSVAAGKSQPSAPVFAEATRETSTGEENESCRLQLRCKLYRLDPEEGNWIECGVGNARILAAEGKDGKTERARITQRQEQTSRLILNTVVQKDRATVFRKSDKHVQLIVISRDTEKKLSSTYLFKFANKENVKEFLDVLTGLGHVRVGAGGDDGKKKGTDADQEEGGGKEDSSSNTVGGGDEKDSPTDEEEK
eukprot:CAMPEP_0194273072 /NCGR_PEP_ID=MMETSP0169-20130528/6479_1 /TAXON_ID=218684 /ORGANISM="Corethron pennatum, Strain L29A3" /LENGTH=391 /DNA_ID=CAMNT_0039015911 /DNA_START=22 /DNA_END=1197 /DNA_ORIENTATION=-